MTLAGLSAVTSLHPNTLREHLESLESRGSVRRRRADPSGRGRPAWLYESTGTSTASRAAEYAGLATALASVIARHSPDPRGEALEAGRNWGHALGNAKGLPHGRGAASVRRGVVALLADLGFSPEPSARATSVRLTRCPLLNAARAEPDIVCSVHLGIVRGALQEWGADSQNAELLPFSEPGACKLLLPLGRRQKGAHT
jgi:predicted ArsR family transcriptional regulator